MKNLEKINYGYKKYFNLDSKEFIDILCGALTNYYAEPDDFRLYLGKRIDDEYGHNPLELATEKNTWEDIAMAWIFHDSIGWLICRVEDNEFPSLRDIVNSLVSVRHDSCIYGWLSDCEIKKEGKDVI